MIAKVRARHERGSSRKSGIPWLWLSLGAIGLLIFLAIALSFPTPSEGLKVGDPAPSFNLPSTDETEVALADYQGEKNVLLFFSMTDGCVPCMLQIKDLQKDTELQAMDVALVSIGTDPLPKLISAAREFGITTPLLSDQDGRVSRAYGVLRWAMRNGEPGHTFVLVDKQGAVRLIKDYGAPENGGLMYVGVEELDQEIQQALAR